MSAPAGWHPQPDGRERWWDGQQWTEHFRDPAAAAPTPGETQVLGTTGSTGYDTPGAQAGGYGAPGPQATGYGTPGAQWPQEKKGMGGTAKGCLIAAVVTVVLLIAAVVVGGIFFFRAVDETVDQVQSAIPSGLPTNLPTSLPSAGGDPVTITLGDGFELPNATIDGGWTLEDNGGIGRVVTGMTATSTGSIDVPVLFSMAFEGGQQTVCTATFADGADSAEVTCIPVFGDVADGAEVTVTPTL